MNFKLKYPDVRLFNFDNFCTNDREMIGATNKRRKIANGKLLGFFSFWFLRSLGFHHKKLCNFKSSPNQVCFGSVESLEIALFKLQIWVMRRSSIHESAASRASGARRLYSWEIFLFFGGRKNSELSCLWIWSNERQISSCLILWRPRMAVRSGSHGWMRVVYPRFPSSETRNPRITSRSPITFLGM